MFRPLRFLPHVLLILLLAAGLSLALATRYPQAEILAAAEGWPLVGGTVERFRRVYLPPAPAAATPDAPVDAADPAPGAPAAPEIEIVRVIDPELVGPKPKVWAPPGTPILTAPDPGGREVGRVEHLFPLSRLERRGDWFRVRYGTRLSGFDKGWVYLPDYREPTPEELNAPAPVLPLAPVPIAAETLAAARRHLGEAVDGGCGPFGLLSDTRSRSVLETCERVGAGVEDAHRRRYGLDLVGEARETILLFDREADFLGFRDEVSRELTGDAFASAARGFVAVPVGGRAAEAVESSLIHELTHLLNRRALGPALPPWLDEGLARDLDTVGVGEAARSGVGTGGGDRVESLERLFDLDQTGFQRRAEHNYEAAGRWIGYLVAGPEPQLGERMRGFLRAVSRGEPIRAELLLGHLGRDWAELEAGFRAWEHPALRVASD